MKKPNKVAEFFYKAKLYIASHKYLLYILYLPIYFAMFFFAEHMINGSSDYWVSYTPLDDKIPFISWFVIFYYVWYPLMVGIGLWILFKDIPAFERYMKMIILGFTTSIIVFFIFPNGQNLRPAYTGDDIFGRIIQHIYSIDTNTNVLPSIHVYGSVIAVIACYDTKTIKNGIVPAIYLFLGILVCASTLFIKQHSILDLYAGVGMAVPYFFIVYGKRVFARLKKLAPAPAVANSKPYVDDEEDIFVFPDEGEYHPIIKPVSSFAPKFEGILFDDEIEKELEKERKRKAREEKRKKRLEAQNKLAENQKNPTTADQAESQTSSQTASAQPDTQTIVCESADVEVVSAEQRTVSDTEKSTNDTQQVDDTINPAQYTPTVKKRTIKSKTAMSSTTTKNKSGKSAARKAGVRKSSTQATHKTNTTTRKSATRRKSSSKTEIN